MLIPEESRLSGGITPITSVQTCWKAPNMSVIGYAYLPAMENRSEKRHSKEKDFIHQNPSFEVNCASC